MIIVTNVSFLNVVKSLFNIVFSDWYSESFIALLHAWSDRVQLKHLLLTWQAVLLMHCLRCYFQAKLCRDANCVVSSYTTLKATCLSMTPKESRLVFVYYKYSVLAVVQSQVIFSWITCPVMKFLTIIRRYNDSILLFIHRIPRDQYYNLINSLLEGACFTKLRKLLH